VASYNWILTPASIFVGHYLKEFYSKFENILTDSLSLINFFKNTFLDKDYFLFTRLQKFIYQHFFQGCHKNNKRIIFRYQNVIPSAHFFLESMELMLNCAIMKFQEDFFMQILGIVMGTNLAPILTNIYMAILEEELYIICKNKNITWPNMFKDS